RLPQSVPYRNHVAQALAHARTHDSEEFFRRKLGDISAPPVPFGLLDVHGSAGAQRILGMFIITLPLRLQLQDVTVKELVEQTQRELVELLNHEQASL